MELVPIPAPYAALIINIEDAIVDDDFLDH
jgi:hypothetical protein